MEKRVYLQPKTKKLDFGVYGEFCALQAISVDPEPPVYGPDPDPEPIVPLEDYTK